MRQMALLEIERIIQELDISGYYIDKIYEFAENSFRIKLSKGSTKKNLEIIIPFSINFTKYLVSAVQPTNFAIAARKLLSNNSVVGVRQLNKDRIIEIETRKKGLSYFLIIELFAKGNLVIADSSHKVLLAYSKYKGSEREIRKGDEYALPENSSRIRGISAAKNVIERVAAYKNIGMVYLEDAILKAGLDPRADAASIPDTDMQRLLEKIEEEIKESKSGSSYVYMDEDKPIDYSIVKLKKYEGKPVLEFKTLSEALDLYCNHEMLLAKEKPNPQIEKLKKSIEKQKQLMLELDKKADEYKNIANLIFANMNLINQVIITIRENENIPKEKLEAILPFAKVLAIDKKSKTIKLELSQ
ncbi:MAG: NFACT family protein [Candidatus Micrarchaeia archaeon]